MSVNSSSVSAFVTALVNKVSALIGAHDSDGSAHSSLFSGKVDKVSGKGLSANDFTNTYKGNLDDLVDVNKTVKNGHTHSGYVSATKVTSWSSTVSDSNIPSEKLVSDTFDAIEDLIGDAIAYINQ